MIRVVVQRLSKLRDRLAVPTLSLEESTVEIRDSGKSIRSIGSSAESGKVPTVHVGVFPEYRVERNPPKLRQWAVHFQGEHVFAFDEGVGYVTLPDDIKAETDAAWAAAKG